MRTVIPSGAVQVGAAERATGPIGVRSLLCVRRQPRGVRLAAWLVLALAAGGLAAAPGRAWAETGAQEYQLKAAFLLNFARFVEWPAEAFAAPGDPIRIGILGENPFGSGLEDTLRDETAHGRRLVVKHARRVDELADCQLVFVSRSEKGRTAEILAALAHHAVLTVGDPEQFAAEGGAIGFFLDGKRVRFEINPEAAKQQQLKMNAQLLTLGRIVGAVHGGEH